MCKVTATLCLLTCVLAGCSAGVSAPASQPSGMGWTEDYNGALAQAQSDHKLVLLNFTGSDWCEPCQHLDRTVFDSADFQKWAAGKFELVTLDFPARKPQDDAIKARNKALNEQYKVPGYPTIVIVDPAGKVLAQSSGFAANGTAAAWIADMQGQLAKTSPKASAG